MRMIGAIACGLLLGLACFSGQGDGASPATSLRFEVTVAKGLLTSATDGRMLVVLGKDRDSEPRFWIGEVGMNAPPVLGRDANGFSAGRRVILDSSSAIFPIDN